METVMDSWTNSYGETVQLVGGQLRVLNARGERIRPHAVVPTRCDTAAPARRWHRVEDTSGTPSTAPTARSSHNVDANGVIELPFMAIKPYWKQPKK